MSGLFITFEGVDSSGKTTQIEILKKYLQEKNFDVVCTRDPGDTCIGEKIREILLDDNNTEMSFITETLLYSAARAQLIKEIIKPALQNNKIVICDRFTDSSLVYQGIARKVGIKNIEIINNIVTQSLKPDLTLFLCISPEVVSKRKANNKLDRIEQEKEEFYNQVHKGYLEIYKNNKDRIKLIDASLSLEEVQKQIKIELSKVLDF